MKLFRMFTAGAMLLLAVVMVGCSNQKYAYETVENDPLNAKMYTLPNGLKVYMTVNKEQPRIQANIAVRTGGKNDPAETTGLSHYLEHLMFKGTTHFGTQDWEAEKPLIDTIYSLYEQYRVLTDEAERAAMYHVIDSISGVAAKLAIPNEYNKLMAMIGASGTNAYTSEDVTCYVENIPSNQIENWAKVQSDRFKNPVFRLFHTELEAVYEEKNMSLTNDFRKELATLSRALYPTHPYGTQTVLGEQEHLKNPSLVNIRNYFNTWYVPNNIAICVSGDFDPDNMMDIITKYFGDWAPSANLPKYNWPEQPVVEAPIEKEVFGQEAENVALAWRVPGMSSHEAEMMQVVGSLLYNGSAGLLDLDLNQSQKVLAAQGMYDDMADGGIYLILGMPLPGQKLEEVRDLLLEEVAKLAAGEFDDDLLQSVITDYKLSVQRQLEDNDSRASLFVNSFVNGTSWADEVGMIGRMEKFTKEQVQEFTLKFLAANNYAVVYKRQGVDTSITKIKKPAITPIEANRDAVSAFVDEMKNSVAAVKPIEPVFVDFKTDLEYGALEHGQEVIYKKNETNQTFELSYLFEMGNYADKTLDYMGGYVDYLGTSTMSPEEVQKALYKLGCTMSMNASNRRFYITLSGLDENLEAAVKLLDNVLNDAQPDDDSFNSYKAMIAQSRVIQKTRQNSIARALNSYALYGPEYVKANTLTNAELGAMTSADMVNKLQNLKNLKHRVLYYGPTALEQVTKVLNENHVTAAELQDVPANAQYTRKPTTATETYFTHYEAPNSVLTQVSVSNEKFDLEQVPYESMYNEYFGGSMNGIVFQEMRETRALAYSAYAYYNVPGWLTDTYYYLAQITTQTDKLQDAQDHFQEIINNMPESEAAFQNAKTALIARVRTQRTTRSSVIWSYLNAKDLNLAEEPFAQAAFEKIQQMELSDIVEYQQQKIKGAKFVNCLVADKKLVDWKVFEKSGPVKKLTLEEVFGY